MADGYMAQFAGLLSGMTAPVGTGAGKPPSKAVETKPVTEKYKIGDDIPDNIRKIIEDSEKNGTAIPDKIDGGEVQKKSFMEEMYETIAKGGKAIVGNAAQGAASGAMSGITGGAGGLFGGALGGALGGGIGGAGAAIGEKLGEVWVRWIVIVVGVIILALGLYMFSNAGIVKVGNAVVDSGPGKIAKKLIPAGKVASVAKGLL